MVKCGSAFEPGASGLPDYCTSICVRSCCYWRASCVDSKKKSLDVNAHQNLKSRASCVGCPPAGFACTHTSSIYMVMLSKFAMLCLMLFVRNRFLCAKIASCAPMGPLSSAEPTWGAVAISPFADLYAKFWAQFFRELPLPLPPGLSWSAEPAWGAEGNTNNAAGLNQSWLQRWRLMQLHWHPPCEDCILAQTVLSQT